MAEHDEAGPTGDQQALDEEHRLLRGWYLATRDQVTFRTPFEWFVDQWRRVRRRETAITVIDEAVRTQTLALAALLRSAERRGDLSDDLQFRIREALLHESLRVRVQDAPVGESLSAAAALLPALASVAEASGVAKYFWQIHHTRLRRLARRVLLERGLGDPLDEQRPKRRANWREGSGLTTALPARLDPSAYDGADVEQGAAAG